MVQLAADKVVFVTGGASGIGRAAAREFSAEGGAHVVVADLDIAGAEATVASLAGPGSSVMLDVGDEAAVEAAIDSLVAEHGRVVVGVHLANATVAQPGRHRIRPVEGEPDARRVADRRVRGEVGDRQFGRRRADDIGGRADGVVGH